MADALVNVRYMVDDVARSVVGRTAVAVNPGLGLTGDGETIAISDTGLP